MIEVGELVIDLTDRSVTRGGEPVHLTRIEFELLRVLAQHQGRLVTHRQLLQEVWGPEYGEETHYLRVHVAHIRSKLEPDPSRPQVPDHRARRRLPPAGSGDELDRERTERAYDGRGLRWQRI